MSWLEEKWTDDWIRVRHRRCPYQDHGKASNVSASQLLDIFIKPKAFIQPGLLFTTAELQPVCQLLRDEDWVAAREREEKDGEGVCLRMFYDKTTAAVLNLIVTPEATPGFCSSPRSSSAA